MDSNYQLNRSDILDHFLNTDFVLKTQQQILKDFEISGNEFHAVLRNTAFSYEDLTEILSEMLSAVMKKGERQTLQLFYQIDIPQDQFLKLTTDPEFLIKISELIIRREAQKVYLRSVL